MVQIPSLSDLMKAGAHFGHQQSKWHPKMKPFIFTAKNGVHIINLEETQKQIALALDFLQKTVSAGGTVLFLGTKKQAQEIVKDAALSCNMPYITSRWLGGTLTNSTTILGVVKKYRKLKEDNASGKLDKFTKKEKLEMIREMERLSEIVGGMEKMDRVPEALFVVDIKTEKTAILEAKRQGVPVVAICDSNTNPDLVDWPIPANDDALKSIEVITKLVAEAISAVKK